MLTPWLTDDARDRLTSWSEAIDIDLVRLGTTADAEEIKDTAITQPLVVASALLAFEQLDAELELPADLVVAGHSVGELAAAVIAGVLDADTAVALAATRGAAMADACTAEPTGMAAVMSKDEPSVLAALEELDLVPANRNGAGQIVAAGPAEAITKLMENKPDGAKVVPLKVAGAFHTRYMASARDSMFERAAGMTFADASRILLSNADGAEVRAGAEIRKRLVEQVVRPVRWDLCMATMRRLGVDTVIELPPAGALTGLAKRELTGTRTLAVKTPDRIAGVAELMRN
jgi:[acyl-carrier-protein] S-malonyltransferase